MNIGIGLFGNRGHQIQRKLVDHPRAKLVATGAFDRERLPDALQQDGDVKHYDTLDELLADERVQLVSLCSPRRADQAAQTIQCLEAGKAAYAEKPCALIESDLDALIETTRRTGVVFREMSGSAFFQPYLAMRQLVQAGRLGEVVQVFAQKSYPMHGGRPQDEQVDGGLILQNGVHAFRFVEHITGLRIVEVDAVETSLGNPDPAGGLRVAASAMMRLENGAVASVVMNYLNQKEGLGSWGNEHVRVFGVDGFAEITDGGQRTRLIIGDTDHGEIDASEPSHDYFEQVLDEFEGKSSMPLSLEDDLHPTRMVIRAKAAADRRAGGGEQGAR